MEYKENGVSAVIKRLELHAQDLSSNPGGKYLQINGQPWSPQADTALELTVSVSFQLVVLSKKVIVNGVLRGAMWFIL